MMMMTMTIAIKFINQALTFPEQLLVFSALLQEVSDDDYDDEEEDHIDYDDGDDGDEGEEVLGSTTFTE